MLIISESTSYPGTTEEVLKPLIEEGGLVSGKDFYLAYSPERVDPGNKNFPIEKIPKLVGGVCAESSELALQFYGNFIDSVVKMSSPRVAEMAPRWHMVAARWAISAFAAVRPRLRTASMKFR